MQIVALRCLIALSLLVSTSLTHHAFDRIFIRGRDAWETYAMAVLALSLAWEAYKFIFFHSGMKLACHVTPAKRLAGRCAIGVAVVMMFGSVASVAHGMRTLLAPTDAEASEAERDAEREKNAELDAERKAERERLWSEHAALVGTRQLTRAREVAEQIRDLERIGTPENVTEWAGMGRNVAERDGIYHQKSQNSQSKPMTWLCFGVGLLVEVISLTCVWLHAVGSRSADVLVRSPAFSDAPAHSAGTLREDVLEELRTRKLRPTVKEVQLRMRCGAVKASAILAEARAMGIISGGTGDASTTG